MGKKRASSGDGWVPLSPWQAAWTTASTSLLVIAALVEWVQRAQDTARAMGRPSSLSASLGMMLLGFIAAILLMRLLSRRWVLQGAGFAVPAWLFPVRGRWTGYLVAGLSSVPLLIVAGAQPNALCILSWFWSLLMLPMLVLDLNTPDTRARRRTPLTDSSGSAHPSTGDENRQPEDS